MLLHCNLKFRNFYRFQSELTQSWLNYTQYLMNKVQLPNVCRLYTVIYDYSISFFCQQSSLFWMFIRPKKVILHSFRQITISERTLAHLRPCRSLLYNPSRVENRKPGFVYPPPSPPSPQNQKGLRKQKSVRL